MCPSCGESNFLVKKVRGQLRLVHDRNVKSKAACANFVSLCADAVKETPEMESMVDKLAEEMDPLRSLTLFRNISNEDCEVRALPFVPLPAAISIAYFGLDLKV